jgi:hypothetical protein
MASNISLSSTSGGGATFKTGTETGDRTYEYYASEIVVRK